MREKKNVQDFLKQVVLRDAKSFFNNFFTSRCVMSWSLFIKDFYDVFRTFLQAYRKIVYFWIDKNRKKNRGCLFKYYFVFRLIQWLIFSEFKLLWLLVHLLHILNENVFVTLGTRIFTKCLTKAIIRTFWNSSKIFEFWQENYAKQWCI